MKSYAPILNRRCVVCWPIWATDAADQPLDERLLAQYRTPSQTTTEWSAICQNGDLLDGWRQQLTAEELGMGDYILNVFGLGQIYNSSRLRPNRQAAEHPRRQLGRRPC